MDQSFERLNQLSAARAEAEFLKCCSSTGWAKGMTEARPFEDLKSLLSKADEIWWSLGENNWLEAFRAHPKIGEKKAATAQSEQAQTWSAQEQSSAQQAAVDTKVALAQGNREYEERFGFIFIICASGKSADEILASLKQRLANDPETEIRLAAEEQRKIAQLRLTRMLASDAST
ncbi:MAG TPA: 2-oxo-4-hydroxy-4-carboxy-5-ureidoimidazoline decarboxylase [Pyrinomonadaceae bacterium]|jgi:OHCU decarboxylase|nr:2-oxo-4-hydroxy-4-carboxy-5-ureidoimidazoline decarboxylase [Pyrinomonadaceae bacterium]